MGPDDVRGHRRRHARRPDPRRRSTGTYLADRRVRDDQLVYFRDGGDPLGLWLDLDPARRGDDLRAHRLGDRRAAALPPRPGGARRPRTRPGRGRPAGRRADAGRRPHRGPDPARGPGRLLLRHPPRARVHGRGLRGLRHGRLLPPARGGRRSSPTAPPRSSARLEEHADDAAAHGVHRAAGRARDPGGDRRGDLPARCAATWRTSSTTWCVPVLAAGGSTGQVTAEPAGPPVPALHRRLVAVRPARGEARPRPAWRPRSRSATRTSSASSRSGWRCRRA